MDHRRLEIQAAAALERGDFAEALGLTRLPTEHVGKDATAMERRGEQTDRCAQNERITAENEATFAALLAKFEKEGRVLPVPEAHSHARAKRERGSLTPVQLSSVGGGGQIQVVRGLARAVRPTDQAPLATPDERRTAAVEALEEIAAIWHREKIANRLVTVLEATALIVRERAALLASFVDEVPFVVYVREMLRRLKALKRDITRFARREGTEKRALRLFHQAQIALESFDAEPTKAGIWSRREWAKRRTRRVAAVELREKELKTARQATAPEAERSYKERASVSAQALEDWSRDDVAPQIRSPRSDTFLATWSST